MEKKNELENTQNRHGESGIHCSSKLRRSVVVGIPVLVRGISLIEVVVITAVALTPIIVECGGRTFVTTADEGNDEAVEVSVKGKDELLYFDRPAATRSPCQHLPQFQT